MEQKTNTLTADMPIDVLSGATKKRVELYEKLNINNVGDLLLHYPRRYIDFSKTELIQTAPVDTHISVKGLVTKKIPPQRIRPGLVIYKVTVQDESDSMSAVFYNNQYVYNALMIGEEYIFHGKIIGGFTRKEMNNPNYIETGEKCKFRPVYRMTEGINSAVLIKDIEYSLTHICTDFYNEFLPPKLLEFYELPDRETAIKNVHFPESDELLKSSLKRLAFEELLLLQLGMALIKNRNRESSAYKIKPHQEGLRQFYETLDFTLTNAQLKAIADITADLSGEFPMNRLLQGDVGSGKTVVAAAAALCVTASGFQTALMAPTEILARQHYKTLTEFLTPLGINVCCVTGAVKGKARQTLNDQILNGEFDVIIGTHALFSGDTTFKNLALVIMDEQHRFGVSQRAALAEKSVAPHTLIMSATPIPRTLSLIIYGDLDITILDELPKGRVKIETHAVTDKLRERALGFVKKEISKGRQAYIICPVIEEGKSELAAAKSYTDMLQNTVLKDNKTGLLHGRMSAVQKDEIMTEFKEKKLDILVATTVVEVGVDVPNATIILIENAERFGLSQLHQLRGRVGRSIHQSYCILITGNPTDSAKERLKIMTEVSDGFELSEYDLKLRGAGDFFGERQHGLPSLKVADISADGELLAKTSQAAQRLIENSPDLSHYPMLKLKVDELFEDKMIIDN